MKKKTEYNKVPYQEVAEEGNHYGWPVKGFFVSNDEKNWKDRVIEDVSLRWGYKSSIDPEEPEGWKYCAQAVERFEWEIGDQVEVIRPIRANDFILGPGDIGSVCAVDPLVKVSINGHEFDIAPYNLKPAPKTEA